MKKNKRRFPHSKQNSRSNSREPSRKASENEVPNKITFQNREVRRTIRKEGKYEKDDATIIKWESDNDEFLAQIKSEGFNYIGVLNADFNRQGLGINFFKNGEKYLGEFKANAFNKHGFYKYEPKKENGKINSEFYWGFWQNGVKDVKGVQIWLTEDEEVGQFGDFDKADFNIYLGKIEKNNYKKGLYLTKKGDAYNVYYGEFDAEGKKTGKNCFYYNATNDILLYGEIQNDYYVNACLADFDPDEGTINEIIDLEYDEDHNISKVVEENEIESSDEIRQKMMNFRGIMLEEDIFGNIYKAFKEINDFVEGINSYEQFNDQDFYPKIIKTTTSYNGLLDISGKIEKNI